MNKDFFDKQIKTEKLGQKMFPMLSHKFLLTKTLVKKVNKLISAGANVNAQDNTGNTLLMKAIYFDKPEIIELLIKAGALLNVQNENGETALMKAVINYRIKCAELLIKAGADISITDSYGYNAVMKTVFATDSINAMKDDLLNKRPSKTEILRMLINAGADLEAKSADGETALLLATAKGEADIRETIDYFIRKKQGLVGEYGTKKPKHKIIMQEVSLNAQKSNTDEKTE